MLSMTDIFIFAAIAAAASAVVVLLVLRRLRFSEANARLGEQLVAMEKRLSEEIVRLRESLDRALRESVEAQGRMQLDSTSRITSQIRESLDAMRQDNESKLEKIRATVDEKLQSTLETRLGESFKLVSERLEQVYKGLGDMQELARGVGDLKNVLTNVKTRGGWGEIQLENLIDQILTREQYEKNVISKKGRSERVDIAIKLPGRDTINN